MSVGILVTNSIVVLEAIVQRLDQTGNAREAVRLGAKKVTVAVLGMFPLRPVHPKRGQAMAMEAPQETRRIAILEFPSLEQGKEWYACDDNQSVKKLRADVAQGELFVANGV